ncbi:MAG TPA: F0F1 ATP synthase subunit beta, partial [Planctomycetes bacterium]|nr:F0F1 ATP synthase subunit beta [Planctomycetota bacterium]
LEVPRPDEPLWLEVVLHSGEDRVRALAFNDTRGVALGQQVWASGAPLRVPVGEQVRGRVLDVLGRALDEGAPFTEPQWPILRASPTLTEHDPSQQVFETGLKV